MTLSKERLTSIAVAPGLEPCDYEETYSSITTGEIQAMARELLERRERDKQEPVISVIFKDGWPIPETVGIVAGSDKLPDGVHEFYAAPQPAPVAQPEPIVPENLPCPVLLEPGLRFGKGVPTQTMLDALQRRAEYYAELEAMTPEQRADHDAGMKEFAAMLQSFGNSEQLNSPSAPDGWISVCDQMPDQKSERRVCVFTPTPHEDMRYRFVPASLFKAVCSSATHWYYIEPPSAPKQESE